MDYIRAEFKKVQMEAYIDRKRTARIELIPLPEQLFSSIIVIPFDLSLKKSRSIKDFGSLDYILGKGWHETVVARGDEDDGVLKVVALKISYVDSILKFVFTFKGLNMYNVSQWG